jgi:hypothetical protein
LNGMIYDVTIHSFPTRWAYDDPRYFYCTKKYTKFSISGVTVESFRLARDKEHRASYSICAHGGTPLQLALFLILVLSCRSFLHAVLLVFSPLARRNLESVKCSLLVFLIRVCFLGCLAAFSLLPTTPPF